jgi:hypothetical protein
MSYDTYSAFHGQKLLARGPLADVVTKVKRQLDKTPDLSILIFSDATGKEMDFNFQGSAGDVLRRLEVFVPSTRPETTEAAGPGRPKLGVVSREVSLLPRHWEWLATQPGGASPMLRKLVEEARKGAQIDVSVKQAQERTYRVMSVLAGNQEGYEEALRALYRKDKKTFQAKTKAWPKDVLDHLRELAKPAFVAS